MTGELGLFSTTRFVCINSCYRSHPLNSNHNSSYSTYLYRPVDAAATAYSKQHGRGQLKDWKTIMSIKDVARLSTTSVMPGFQNYVSIHPYPFP